MSSNKTESERLDASEAIPDHDGANGSTRKPLETPPLEAVVNSASIGIGVVNADGRIKYSNQRLAKTLGYGLEELKGVPLANLAVPSERDRVGRELRELAKGGGVLGAPINAIVQKKDGGRVHVQISFSPCEVDGELQGYACVVTNVSEVVAHERRCFEICTLLEAAFDSANSGMIFARKDGTIAQVNTTVGGLFDVDLDELRGQELQDAVPTLQQAVKATPSLVDLVLGDGAGESDAIVKGSGRQGDLSLRVRRSEVRTAGGDVLGTLAVFDDLSAAIQMEHEISESRRLSFIGRMAASIAHEVNAPLTNIALLEARLRERLGNEDPALEEMLDNLKAQWNAIHRLTSDLLRLSYGGSSGEEAVSVDALVESAASALAGVLPPTMEISRSPCESPLNVKVNRDEMERVLTSLLTNASESMDGAGRISIEWEPTSRGMVEIRIQDAGTGIPPHLQERIFEPFFTTKGLGKRTGLGLSLARNVVESHGGRILVESEPDKGSTFRILLPVIKDDPGTSG